MTDPVMSGKDEDLAQSIASGIIDAWGQSAGTDVAEKQLKKPEVAGHPLKLIFYGRVLEIVKEKKGETTHRSMV